MKQQRLEDDFQVLVCDYLRLVVPPDVIWFAASNGALIAGTARLRAMRVALLKRMGMKVGIPDLIFLRRHHPFGIELKAPGKEKNLSPNQKDVRTEFAGASLTYYVASSVEEVRQILRAERVIN
jgi:hypothetical protein